MMFKIRFIREICLEETEVQRIKSMIIWLHHFAIVQSANRSVEFYSKLGFQKVFRKERDCDTIVILEGCGIQIEAFIDPRYPAKGDIEPLGLRHIALKVDNIEKTIEELNLNVLAINRDWVGIKYCNIIDPDGNVVEFRE